MKGITFFTAILLLLSSHLNAQTTSVPLTQGPANGSLILIGGGHLGEEIIQEFKEQAGGDTARIVVIPTALDDESLGNKETSFQKMKTYFKKAGFTDITILHTRDSSRANNPGFIKPLKKATGIYFYGGRQWRIADGFLDTKAHQEMFNLLDRGGVIAGSSAGATIQGSYLARGDTKTNQIMMGDHEEGLGFISNVAVDQHIIARNRQFDMFDILKEKPHLLGIGLDESTAIVVNGNTFEVIGESYVAIYDNAFWSREGSDMKTLPEKEKLFYFLRSGDRYNMKKREVANDSME